MSSNIADATKKMEEARISAKDGAVEYFPLKMLQDKKTEMYVKFAKVLVIFQGPYTDIRAKTSNEIAGTFKYASSVVSDKRFKMETHTLCSYERTKDFYDYFKYISTRALEEGNNLLVIDSTMSNVDQNRYYIALAYKMQYVVLVVPPVVTKSSGHIWPKGSLAASFRNEGNTVIPPTNMYQHLFCAWYLHDVDSNILRDDACLYIQDCLEEISEFRILMEKNCLKMGPDGEKLSHIDAIKKHYYLEDKRQDLAFCVTKIIGSSLKLMNDYFKKQSVQGAYGKMSKLFIVGYVISPHMIAARVKLIHAQKDLWEIDDELDENDESCSQKLICPSQLLEDFKKELPDVCVQLISSKSNPTLLNSGQTVDKPFENIHPFGKGRACHIVLGKAAGACPHHVDFGVQFALKRERNFVKAKADIPVYELEKSVVKRVGKYWFIYLRENMRIDALFASCAKPFPFDQAILC